MATIQQVRHNAEALVTNEPMRSLCLGLIDQVAERLSRGNQGLWTFQVLSAWVGLSPTSRDLHRCIQLLSSSSELKLLETHFLLFDPSDEEDEGVEVDDEEVAQAYATGFIVHPDTGERIDDFEPHLVPYFTPGVDEARSHG